MLKFFRVSDLRQSKPFWFLATVLIVIFSVFSIPKKYFYKKVEDARPNNKAGSGHLEFQSPKTELVATGDVMLGRSVMSESLDLGDSLYPFRKVAGVLTNADIVFINLENPIIKDCPSTSSGFKFCANPDMVEGVVFSGVDVVSLANNHSGNFGKTGLNETSRILSERGILVTGMGGLVTLDKNGTRFGFLGFDKSQEVSPKLTKAEVDLIKKADKEVEVLVIGMHWGVEYQDRALPGVKSLAKELLDLGADVIVGHHPHWVQDVEYCEGNGRCQSNRPSEWTGIVPIYYSLGNFVFDQMWSEKTKEGLLVRLTFEEDKIVNEELLKIYMISLGQPEIVGER